MRCPFRAQVTLIAAQTGLDTAVTTFAIAWALAITYNVAILEKWGADKGQLIGFIVTLGAVGELSRRGIMPASWAFNIMVPFFLFTGFMIDRLMPQQIMAQFVPDMSGAASTPLVKSLFLNFSFTKVRPSAAAPLTPSRMQALPGLAHTWHAPCASLRPACSLRLASSSSRPS
jgi:hypothetical protein